MAIQLKIVQFQIEILWFLCIFQMDVQTFANLLYYSYDLVSFSSFISACH